MRGFTLIEMIVALGIFAVVALISTSSLLSLTDAEKKSFSLQNSYDNLRFALETITKDIRTGEVYHCGEEPPAFSEPQDCASGASSFTYTNTQGNQITYKLSGSRIEKTELNQSGSSADFLTGPDIVIQNLTFYVLGSLSNDNLQPRVTMLVHGRAGEGRSASEFNLQTTVTQRKKVNQ